MKTRIMIGDEKTPLELTCIWKNECPYGYAYIDIYVNNSRIFQDVHGVGCGDDTIRVFKINKNDAIRIHVSQGGEQACRAMLDDVVIYYSGNDEADHYDHYFTATKNHTIIFTAFSY